MAEDKVTKGDRIAWSSNAPIWRGYSGDPQCHLCNEKPGVVYRKGHARKNGIICENSVMYCQECADNKPAQVEMDFEKWWASEWARCEAEAEKNWQEKGVYTNVGHSADPTGLSKHFGYVKLEDGTFRPYRFVHPENTSDEFERDTEDERHRLQDLPLTDKQKFEGYILYLEQYTPQDDIIKRRVEHELKKTRDWLEKFNEAQARDGIDPEE